MEQRFVGKVAFVTGATTGIGQATAVRLASEGALVGVNQRPSDDPTETLRRIKEAGGEGFPVVADVRDPAQVVAMVQEVARCDGGGGSAPPGPARCIDGGVDRALEVGFEVREAFRPLTRHDHRHCPAAGLGVGLPAAQTCELGLAQCGGGQSRAGRCRWRQAQAVRNSAVPIEQSLHLLPHLARTIRAAHCGVAH